MTAGIRLSLSATLHCLTGCAIGEVLGMVIGGVLGWGNGATIALSIGLAFVSGYSLTLRPLFAAGLPARTALSLALASDTVSIGIMEIVDNAVMLAIPGAMHAHPTEAFFWVAMLIALVLAGAAALPVNHWLIHRGRGHAVIHGLHGHHGHETMVPQSHTTRHEGHHAH